jgi:hypothetical protein
MDNFKIFVSPFTLCSTFSACSNSFVFGFFWLVSYQTEKRGESCFFKVRITQSNQSEIYTRLHDVLLCVTLKAL